jgi:hypothetical protein
MRHYPPRPDPSQARHTGWSPTRDRAAQARFRKALIERSGGHCEYLYPNGQRCGSTHRLQAHHDRPGYGPGSGRLLCDAHHKLEDPHAR